jgi:hypothetical protein
MAHIRIYYSFNLKIIMKKKQYLIATALIFVLSFSSVIAKEKNNKPVLTETQKARIEVITKRIEEIKNIDRSQLDSKERKNLRNELIEMKKELKATNGGVYLSVGAIIIILLILILLL